MSAITVTIGKNSIDNDPVSVARGGKVNWKNETGETITLGLPAIFSPTGDPTIPNGDTSRDYTVNANATVGDHTYTITTTTAVPRNGTIDVT